MDANEYGRANMWLTTMERLLDSLAIISDRYDTVYGHKWNEEGEGLFNRWIEKYGS